jgi:hypothetical protein
LVFRSSTTTVLLMALWVALRRDSDTVVVACSHLRWGSISRHPAHWGRVIRISR